MLVYIAENTKTGNIKVGRTENIAQRRQTLKHKNYEVIQHTFDMPKDRAFHIETSAHRVLKSMGYLVEGREHFNCSDKVASVVLNVMAWPSFTADMFYDNGLGNKEKLDKKKAKELAIGGGLVGFNVSRTSSVLDLDSKRLGLYSLGMSNLRAFGLNIGSCLVLCDELDTTSKGKPIKNLTMIGKNFTLDLLNPNFEKLLNFVIPAEWNTNVLQMFEIVVNALRFGVNLSEYISSSNLEIIERSLGIKLNT